MKFPPKYERTVLFQNKNVEVILIDWEPGAETPIHDHGKSCGLIKVLKGNLTEEFFLPHTTLSVKKFDSNICRQGITVLELPDIIHRMKNTSKIRARSLHIYTPPLVMREYKLKEKSPSTNSGQGGKK